MGVEGRAWWARAAWGAGLGCVVACASGAPERHHDAATISFDASTIGSSGSSGSGGSAGAGSGAGAGGAVNPGSPDSGAPGGSGGAGSADSGPADAGGMPDVVVPPPDHCIDTLMSGDETDQDCGGSCEPCADGDSCIVHDDCASVSCVNLQCAAPTCTDTRANGDETDADCGGPDCDACADGRRCAASGDCESGLCQNQRCECQPDTCADYPGQCASDLDDGCGATLDCSGVCAGADVCYQEACCTPRTSDDCTTCDLAMDDGCGGTVDCSGTVCFTYTTSNFDASSYDGRSIAAVTLDCGVSTFNGTSFGNWCGEAQPLVEDLGSALLLVFNDFTLAQGATLRLTGPKPVILGVYGNAVINGTLDASAQGASVGPGGNSGCGASSGTAGGDDLVSNQGGGGGGGGGFGSSGGGGGDGHSGNDDQTDSNNGGAQGTMRGTPELVPLVGGCSGGAGGIGTSGSGGRQGGGGGGAVQVSAAGMLSIGGSAVVAAAGGGGQRGASEEDGGGGGGSGGAVLLEAGTVNVASGAWITANGGAGSSGNATTGVDGQAGPDGRKNSAAQAAGASGSNGSDGGDGAAGTSSAQAGGNGMCDSFCLLDSDRGAGGGGGGGSIGRIRVNAASSCNLGGNFSPAATDSGCP